MSIRSSLGIAAACLVVGAVALQAQPSGLSPAQVGAFLGTWTFAMTNPPNSEQTVRIVENNGAVTASLQVGKFPPNAVTGMVKDGDLLVLTTTVRENGVPIYSVVALKREGDRMNMAQLLENSQTVKRGTGTKQPD
jgi:hypothetical protein